MESLPLLSGSWLNQTPMKRSKRPRNVEMINQCKGLCILAVIAMHINASLSILLWPAVSVFIIIAAYNNVNSYKRRGHWSLRLKRLLPLYVLFIIIEILIGGWPGWLIVLTGGQGPGSYFVPVLLQVLIALPVLYWIGKRNIYALLIGAFLINLTFNLAPVSPAAYRLCGLRFLFAASIGIWLAFGADRYLPEIKFENECLALAGRYSYHIFLLQTLLFWCYYG